MIESLLIANRGEIARRIIRTARRLGVRTVAVYSEADAGLPFVQEADEAVLIGAAPARESYLDAGKILDVARRTGAAAIHPGYGFLSENADFAEQVLAEGLAWVGAPPAAIRAMGLKNAAKQLMQDAGVPVVPGYMGDDQSAETLGARAREIGFPVLIKAVAGGGGKGMRRVDAAVDFADALASCCREASAYFADDRVLLEKYITSPRHIEVQVFGDTHGNIVHLFERDCSLQRRHQKVIEEAPAPGMGAETRDALCAAAVKAAKAVNYIGAGTIEFIADASEGLRPDRIWFMEMNTRLQVEHPVTEAITGQDLVEWQLLVASGEPLPLQQKDLAIGGWAMEARLYAENPATGFLPSTGLLQRLRLPEHVRVDSGVSEGCENTTHYDPMIAKLIAHGPTRTDTARQLAKACSDVEVWPVRTNAGFLVRAIAHGEFANGNIDTGFIERHVAELVPDAKPPEAVLQAAARALVPKNAKDPWLALPGFRIAAPPDTGMSLSVGGANVIVNVDGARASTGARTDIVEAQRIAFYHGEAWPFGPTLAGGSGTQAASDGAIISPMPGRVIAVDVTTGASVAKGQRLLVLEAMKMEQKLVAPFDGVVSEMKAAAGMQVEEGMLLARVEKDGE